MTKKLLVICGPTATGKTSLSLHLAKLLSGEIVSADSRQVYRAMDVGTGKDLNSDIGYQISDIRVNGDRIGHYKFGEIKIWGYDLVSPKEEFSISQYIDIVRKIIEDIWRRGKLPIVAGGTGFYIKGLVDGIPTANIAQNKTLRKELEGKSVLELLEILNEIDSAKARSLNESDRKNPRRLIRAIEISHQKAENRTQKSDRQMVESDVMFIGLTASKASLRENIEKRVKERIKQGLLGEIENLLNSGVIWEMQSMNTLGYKEWRSYFESRHRLPATTEGDEESERREAEKIINRWTLDEVQYVKRQIVWFEKDKRIKWFDISKLDWREEVEKLVSKWYSDHEYKNTII